MPAFRTTKLCSFHNQPTIAHIPLATRNTYKYNGKMLNAARTEPIIIAKVPNQANG